MRTHRLNGGFADPAVQAAHAFRAVMEVMARPGTIQSVADLCPPSPMSAAAGAVVLTLCDADTSLHLAGAHDTEELRQWIAFHTDAPIVGRERCNFALGSWDALAPLSGYAVGTAEYPDRSATLIVETDALSQTGATLAGPGIRQEMNLSLPETAAFQANHLLFPLGLDFLFTCGERLAALPRSTEVR